MTSKFLHALCSLVLLCGAAAVSAGEGGPAPGSVSYARSYSSSGVAAVAASPRTAIVNSFTVGNANLASSNVGGIGVAGSAMFNISGVDGPVIGAYLYTMGINNSGTGAVYDNPTVTFASTSVTGVSLGDATTNCWGSGSSRAYRFDVTSLVPGNGIYSASGLASCAGCNVDGASLLVFYAGTAMRHDYVVFEGNDSNNNEGFPGETDGWHSNLAGINYTSGSVSAHLFVADGQLFDPGGLDDDSLTFASGFGSVVIPDALHRYDGDSTANAGNSRASNGLLWDVHTFDISAAFGPPGNYSLAMDGMSPVNDCLGLVVSIVELGVGAAPCGNGQIDDGEQCDINAEPTGCSEGLSCLGNCSCGCSTDASCNDQNPCTVDSCSDGLCLHDPLETCPTPTSRVATATATEVPPTPTPTIPAPTATPTTPVNTATPTIPPVTCPPVPAPSCHQQTKPNRGRLAITDWHGKYDKKDRLEWTWVYGEATQLTDFGNPTAGTSNAVCVYNGLDQIVFSASILGGNGWSQRGSAYYFTDSAATQEGIGKIILRARNNKARLRVVGRGKNSNLGNSGMGNFPQLGAMPIASAPQPVRVQLLNSDGECWQSNYLGRIKRNSMVNSRRSAFRARND